MIYKTVSHTELKTAGNSDNGSTSTVYYDKDGVEVCAHTTVWIYYANGDIRQIINRHAVSGKTVYERIDFHTQDGNGGIVGSVITGDPVTPEYDEYSDDSIIDTLEDLGVIDAGETAMLEAEKKPLVLTTWTADMWTGFKNLLKAGNDYQIYITATQADKAAEKQLMDAFKEKGEA